MIKFLSGVFPDETDSLGKFNWLSERVEIRLPDETGFLILSGESPVKSELIVTSSRGSIKFFIDEGRNTIRAPVWSTSYEPITIEFSTYLMTAKDSRKLCFKLRSIGFEPINNINKDTNTLIWPSSTHHDSFKSVGAFLQDGWLRMNAYRTSTTKLHISGILSPPFHRREEIALTVNSIILNTIDYHLTNPDYPFLGRVAFEGEIDLSLFKGATVLRFGSVFLADSLAATPRYQDWIWPLFDDKMPLPTRMHMRRIGALTHDWYIFSGATFVNKLSDIPGASPTSASRVLDWGCGCGRLTRHLIKYGYRRVVGVDIDPINIEWCKKNLPAGHFMLIDPDPPIDLPDNSFDLIVGHSVFTHLSEMDQYLWLEEISRLLAPEGVAVVTIMSGYSTAVEKLPKSAFGHLITRGFLDVGWQADGVDIKKPGYYRKVFHTTDYVIQNWNFFLNVVAILEGYSDHQAAVILRSKSNV